MEVLDVFQLKMRSFDGNFQTLTSSVGLDGMVQCPGSGPAESFENMKAQLLLSRINSELDINECKLS